MRHVARADAHGASHSRVVFVVQIIAAGGRSCWDDGGGSVGRRRIPPPLRPPQLLALRPRGTLGLGLRQRGWGAWPLVAFICLLRRRRSQPLLDWFTARYGGRGRRKKLHHMYVRTFLCFDQHVPCTDEDASFVAASGPSRLLFLKDLVIIISWEGESVGSVDSCGYNDSDAELLA